MLRVRFKEDTFFGRQASDKAGREGIGLAAEAVLGQRPTLELLMGGAEQGPTVAARDAQARSDRHDQTVEAALNHPRVKDAMEIFPETEGNVEVQVDDGKTRA